MATIQKREGAGGLSYRAIVRVHGYPTQTKTFKRLTDAKLWVTQIEAAIHKGEFQSVVREAKRHTLCEVIKRYRKEVLPHMSANTQRATSTYLNYWDRELGDYALSFIDAKTVQKKITALTEGGDTRIKLKIGETPKKPKSRKTIKHYRDTLEVLFKHAKQWGLMGQSPMDGVSRITKINNARVRYLDDDERKRLLDACRNSPNELLYPIVIFALSTGARLGEILKLHTADLNLKQGSATLRDTKNGETRVVPVVEHLQVTLKEHLTWLKAFNKELPSPTPWLFPRRDGQAPIDIRKAWTNARDEAKLTDFRFHDLRHSTASYLAMNGATLLEIAAVLGHKTLQMVKRYSHLSESHTKGIVEKMNRNIFNPDAAE